MRRRRLLWFSAFALVAGGTLVSVAVQLEADDRHDDLGGAGPQRALVLYHPSRDARFSDELSLSLAEGFRSAGFAVERATLTSRTPDRPEGYAIVGLVSNTYYWSPDLPTLRYLARARWDGLPAVGVIGGAGSTGRSQRVLEEALRAAGANVLAVRSFWLWRPNDESRMTEANRYVARDLARRLGAESGRKAQDMRLRSDVR